MMVEPGDNPINDAAFDWLMRVDRGLTSSEQAELDAWLGADIRRFGAFERAKAVFVHVSRTKGLGADFDPGRFDPLTEQAPADSLPVADNCDPLAQPVSRRAFLAASGAVAASGAIAFILAGEQPAQATYQTKRGELRDIVLEDGSSVTLNTDTQIETLFSNRSRSVSLIKGEALFNVSHDAERPFIVDVNAFRARAIGTSFNVQRLAGSMPQLLVKEGVVEVSPGRAAAPLRASVNMKITVTPRGDVHSTTLSPSDLERELIWREGKIAFEDTPLFNAIQSFQRYGDTEISVRNPELLHLTITGVFSSDDPMGFAKVVSEAFDLQAIPEGRGITLARKKMK